VVNDTLNKNWPLNYNSKGKPFTRPDHATQGNPAIAPNRDIFQWGAVLLTSSNGLSKKDKLTVLVKRSAALKAAGGKFSSISTLIKKHQPHPNPKQKDIAMGKARTRKKVVTPQDSDNEENSVSEEPDNDIKTETKPIPIHKTKAKKKADTLLDSDNDEPEANERVNPPSIETLSDEELRIDAEEPNKDIVNTMFKKIQTLMITCEQQDTTVLRQAKMVTESIKFTKEQVKGASREKQAQIIQW
ncbi:hypothetical protein MMC09_006927, partial [Bachmanniomyces sp. S44760]|nr:hypothetical protein [Bachmanniomyces sp. S44760]